MPFYAVQVEQLISKYTHKSWKMINEWDVYQTSGWPRHRENREFGSYFFQTGKHREFYHGLNVTILILLEGLEVRIQDLVERGQVLSDENC